MSKCGVLRRRKWKVSYCTLLRPKYCAAAVEGRLAANPSASVAAIASAFPPTMRTLGTLAELSWGVSARLDEPCVAQSSYQYTRRLRGTRETIPHAARTILQVSLIGRCFDIIFLHGATCCGDRIPTQFAVPGRGRRFDALAAMAACLYRSACDAILRSLRDRSPPIACYFFSAICSTGPRCSSSRAACSSSTSIARRHSW